MAADEHWLKDFLARVPWSCERCGWGSYEGWNHTHVCYVKVKEEYL